MPLMLEILEMFQAQQPPLTVFHPVTWLALLLCSLVSIFSTASHLTFIQSQPCKNVLVSPSISARHLSHALCCHWSSAPKTLERLCLTPASSPHTKVYSLLALAYEQLELCTICSPSQTFWTRLLYNPQTRCHPLISHFQNMPATDTPLTLLKLFPLSWIALPPRICFIWHLPRYFTNLNS